MILVVDVPGRHKTSLKQLKSDPIAYIREHWGWDPRREQLPDFIHIDYKSAAQEAVDVDGLPHFISDGKDEVVTRNNAVAFPIK